MTPKKQANKLLANSIIEKLKIRGMEGFYCDSKEEVIEKVKKLVPEGSSVTWGGSETLKETNVIEELKAGNYKVIDRADAKTPQEQRELYGRIVTADYFFTSTNAITIDGELVNIDGTGNRVSCLIYGPQHVIVVAGMNKVSTNVEEAIHRVHNIASPPNTIRLNKNTPCAKNGKCGNCLGEDTICCQVVVTRKSRDKERIKVILVGEELGF